MSRFALAAAAAAFVAVGCHRSVPRDRDRALAQLPASARVVIAADGAALGAHAMRGALDAAKPYAPASWGCVADAAITADAAALAVGDDGVLVALVAPAPPPVKCPALSHYEPDLWIATVGSIGPVDDRATSVAEAPAWSRARGYLLDAPVAFAAAHGGHPADVVGVARTSPLEVWVAIDGQPAGPLGALVNEWRRAGYDVTSRDGQTIVRPRQLADGDFAKLAHRALEVAAAPPLPVVGFAVACTPDASVLSCRGRELVVRSLADAVIQLATDGAVQVVAGGVVTGVRMAKDALGGAVHAGDVVLGLDSHRVTSGAELAHLAASAGRAATIAVRRGDLVGTIDLRQQE